MVSARHPVVVLGLPASIAAKIQYAKAVAAAMDTNKVTFPSPDPPSPQFASDIAAVDAAQTAAQSKTKGSVQARDEKLAVLRRDLKQLASYVQSIADANGTDGAAVVESTAFAVKRPSIRTKPAFRVAAGRSPGSVNLLAKWAADRALYEWRYSMDRTTWVSLPATIQSSTTVSGFVPLTAYFFQNRVTTTGGRGDWGDPVSFSLS